MSEIECGPGVRSLTWHENSLVDWVDGGTRYALDGTTTKARVRYAYDFDAVVASSDGDYVVLHRRLGTKGLLLHQGVILRELNRSFYQADVYEYPAALWKTPGGRTLLAHCPREYNQLLIEDARTGDVLAAASDNAADVFHSRLHASPSGTLLMSAGWVWHPFDIVALVDVARALDDPSHLSTGFDSPDFNREHASATWLSDALIAVSSSDEDPEIQVWDVGSQCQRACVELDRPAGTMMALGTGHIVAFHGHPRLIRLSDGDVLHEWTELHGGTQLSSIVHHIDPPPPLALDPAHGRFALLDEHRIHVVSFTEVQ